MSKDFKNKTTWVTILTSCVTLVKLLNFSMPKFLRIEDLVL